MRKGWGRAVVMKLGGYFAKRVNGPSDWIDGVDIEEVCSVSEHLSPGPDGWIEKWLHNDLGWYDSPELAWSVVPDDDSREDYRVFAYRLSLERFRHGAVEAWMWPNVDSIPLSPGFHRLGLDIVSKTMDEAGGFECSPLSCCNLAKEHFVNRHCLVDGLDDAVRIARAFSIEEPEPGPYYVVEVLEVTA